MKDLWSKIIDGILLPIQIWVINLMVNIIYYPVSDHFHRPGSLISIVFLMIVSIIFLDLASIKKYSKVSNGWYGILAGITAWKAIEFSMRLDGYEIYSPGNLLILIFVGLIIAVLWRKILPVGVQFFILTLILNWAGTVFYLGLSNLSSWNPLIADSMVVSGVAACILSLWGLLHIFFKSEWCIQRMWIALWVWFLLNYAGMVFLAWM